MVQWVTSLIFGFCFWIAWVGVEARANQVEGPRGRPPLYLVRPVGDPQSVPPEDACKAGLRRGHRLASPATGPGAESGAEEQNPEEELDHPLQLHVFVTPSGPDVSAVDGHLYPLAIAERIEANPTLRRRIAEVEDGYETAGDGTLPVPVMDHYRGPLDELNRYLRWIANFHKNANRRGGRAFLPMLELPGMESVLDVVRRRGYLLVPIAPSDSFVQIEPGQVPVRLSSFPRSIPIGLAEAVFVTELTDQFRLADEATSDALGMHINETVQEGGFRTVFRSDDARDIAHQFQGLKSRLLYFLIHREARLGALIVYRRLQRFHPEFRTAEMESLRWLNEPLAAISENLNHELGGIFDPIAMEHFARMRLRDLRVGSAPR